ncbi:BREX-2 system phosphatase PglZ [Frigoribacterium sp. SL97]|uniref:BREX-2 system phosphatase PglZ n=1 Tax=Frigoribacterium sp. SL97 TaxID=2994664 RepID=UPI00226DBDDA|nr:BREX-2 system phosphatase PglZ [Frigoribacterium sp. SL97]WAC52170.1 BREX-2 system phosphatase PglZ [Frigoribacterium sp. SL97]
MTAPKATEAALRDHLAAWLNAPRRRARTILIRAQPSWSGPRSIDVVGRAVRVVEGVSGLAALDAMRAAGKGEFVAVLTDLDEAALGTAVVLESEHGKLTDLDEWNAVPMIFGARDRNIPRPVRDLGPWVPRLLGSLRRERGLSPAPGGVLSADHVVRSILVALLGLERPEYLDIADALTPLDDMGVRARLTELNGDARAGLIKAVGTHIDQHLAMALRAATAPGRVSVVAVGLVVAELWSSGNVATDAATAAARVRAEHYVGPGPSAAAASRFGAAAQLITRRWLASGDHHARDTFEQAEAICTDLGWAESAAASAFLPAGLRARIKQFAAAIEAAASTPSVASSRAVDVGLEAVETHGARSLFDRSLPTARMTARLARWLAAPHATAQTIDMAIQQYGSDGAWAERALGDLWDGDSDRGLATAYKSLAHAVQVVRHRDDAGAASLLTGAPPFGSGATPVERLLADLVVPVAAEERVLLIVLDGMSAPTAIELAAELSAAGWSELVRADRRRRIVALAALPTITEYSRTSLFAGELFAGNQQIEKSRFAAAVNGIVFHKDDLRSEAGHSLPPAVADTIADPGRKIVGAVLNTIDDALASADVDALRWSLRSVANLEALLAAADTAGRIVILTSDHGHIVERGSELRSVPESSARWRTVESGPTEADEVTVSGPRVLAPGGSAVLAVSDGIRYASKKAGYHGGASLAELTIPVLVLKPRGAEDPTGWVEAPPQEPAWWNEPNRAALPASIEPVKAKAPKVKAPKQPDPGIPTLFDPEQMSEPTPATTTRSIAERLVASPTYQVRRGIAGRHPIDDGVASIIISALDAGNGRAHRDTLATAAGVATGTFAGLLATFRRVLNVDGYPVIELDADGVTVVLDRELLREQFELGSA